MANQIKSYGMARMTIGSCCNFHKKVNALIETATPAALHIEDKAPGYKSATETLASIVNRRKAFVITSSLSEGDDVRDRAGGVIAQVINAYQTSPVEEKQAAAILLAAKIAAYRNIRNHEYTKQTAEVEGMLRELDAEAEAVATLGLTEEVEALRAANAAFDADYSKKAAEASEMDAQSDIKSKDVVEDANTRYAEIVQIVNAYAIVQPSDEINQFINDLNGLVAIYSKIAGSSSGSGSTTETPDEENPGTEPENPDGGDGGDEENPSGPGIPNP